AFGLAAAERAVGRDALEHRLQHLGQEGGLEGRGGLAHPRGGDGGGRGRLEQGRGDGQIAHAHITSISACSAPAALMACRMLIMSRGLTPRAFRPLTRSDSEAPPPTMRICRPRSSSTETSDWGTTAVSPPRLKGSGWLTSGVSCTETVRLPWAMATVETRTASPMTMTPLTSSMITLAGASTATGRFSTRLMKPAMPIWPGARRAMTVPFSARAAFG